jgi:GAF domain-containing protein
MQCSNCGAEIAASTDPTIPAPDYARLVEELAEVRLQLEARTSELRESIQQQTATADLLKVISRSRFELQAVFDALAESAVRLCDGQFSLVERFDGKLCHFAASHGLTSEELKAFQRRLPRPAGEDTASGRAILHRAISQIPDVEADSAYGILDLARELTYRSVIAVPLLRDGNPIGTIVLWRAQVRSFSESQVRLLEIFADQAVIAIENARLFEAEQIRSRELQTRSAELAESLEYQTAISEVLNVISRSPNELQPVLDTIVQTARRLCGAERAVVTMLRDGKYHLVAHDGVPPDVVEYLTRDPILPDRGSATGRVALERKAVQIPNVLADPEYRVALDVTKVRTVLGVPLLRKGEVIGVISMTHTEVKPFTEKQIELITTFADQAVIAINNVGLFGEVQARTKELTESLKQQTATADVLKFISRSAFDLQKVLDTLVESAARLCEAPDANIHLREGELYPHTMAFRTNFKNGLNSIQLRWIEVVSLGERHSRAESFTFQTCWPIRNTLGTNPKISAATVQSSESHFFGRVVSLA